MLSDHIVVYVKTQLGESFLDKMIALVEVASRQKTPNEIALTILLAGFTFVIVCVALQPYAVYAKSAVYRLAPGENGKVVGYANVGQKFTEDRYFNSCPSAVDYNAARVGRVEQRGVQS